MSKRSLDHVDRDEKKKVRKIDARSKEGREASEKLFLEVTTKGRKIMPTNAMKYTGTLYQPRGTNVWMTAFKGRNIRARTHKTKEDAETHKISMNKKHNLPVSNIIYEYENQHFCVLTQNQLMKFSIEKIDVVEKYTWCADYDSKGGNYYAKTTNADEGPDKLRFHRLLFPDLDDDKTIDHFNHETLDNNMSNLRIATMQTQTIHRRMFKNNTTGVTGISVYSHGWRASWQNEKNVTKQRCFGTSKYDDAFNEAVIFLENTRKEMEVYKIAANPIG